MTKPSLRSRIKQYVESAYLHGLCVENLDTGELEPPKDISDTEWITDAILKAIEDSMGEEFDYGDKLARKALSIEFMGGYNQAIRDIKSKLNIGEDNKG